MPTKICVFLMGLVYLLFGIAGLFPSLVHFPPPRYRYYDEIHIIGHWGFLFGWLPVNFVHNVLYIVIGAVAIPASIFRGTAIWYARGVFFLMVMLTFVGFFPLGVAQAWGIIPLFAWNVMLHAVTGMLMFYYGFIYPIDLGGKEPASEMLVRQG